jgi:Mn-dependent DtxR family transcriptional regulator
MSQQNVIMVTTVVLLAMRHAAVKVLLALWLLSLLASHPIAGSAYASTQAALHNRVLVVASDIDDVIWAHQLGLALRRQGLNISVEVVYLWKDYPGAAPERRKLGDIGFLWNYDAILLPDLNKRWMYGGMLKQDEIENLLVYARRGHLVLIGMNTLVQHWYPQLEESTGVHVIGIHTSVKDIGLFDVIYKGRLYDYNDTLGAVLVEPVTANVVAHFVYEDRPAVTLNRYGYGVVVFVAFNIVEAAVLQKNGYEFTKMSADILASLLGGIKPLPPPSSYEVRERLKNILAELVLLSKSIYEAAGGGLLGAAIVALIILSILYVVLLAAAYACLIAPETSAALLRLLLPAKKEPDRIEKSVSLLLSEEVAQGVDEIAERLGISRSAVCRALAWLIARGQVRRVKSCGETYYALSDKAPLAFLAVNPLYRSIAELVQREPGITVHEVAARLGIPFDTALLACKELAANGVLEMRKVMLEYELYPARCCEGLRIERGRRATG